MGPSATELGSLGHHVRGGDEKVKVHHATRDLLHEIVRTREVGTRRLGRGDVVARGEHGDANSLAGALGEGDSGAELLVVVLGVDVETDVALGGLGELGGGVGEHELDSLRRLNRVHAAGHRSLRLAEALGLPRLLGALAILASRALWVNENMSGKKASAGCSRRNSGAHARRRRERQSLEGSGLWWF